MDIFKKLKMIVGCEYISDLRFDCIHQRACKEICNMSLYPYPKSQLEDMAHYLYGEKANFKDIYSAECFFKDKQSSF